MALSSNPRSTAPVMAAVLALLACTACNNNDTRMTLEQFRQAEAEVAAGDAPSTQPGAVNPGAFALKEVKPYSVGVGDVLSVELIGVESEYSRTEFTLRVHADGAITLPLVGKVRVSGLDLAGVEAAVISAFVPDYVPRLSCYAKLATPGETTVVVLGPATSQGVIALPRDERNLLYALGRAGGINPATTGAVIVKPVRPDREEQRYDLTSVNDLRRALTAPPLESGDMIVIEAASESRLFLTGLVNTPGTIAIPRDSKLSLVRAISAAGGLVDFLGPTEATLWRELKDGRQVRVKVPIGEIMSGNQPDFALLPGDVLDVPHTADTRFKAWVLENIRIGPFGVTAVYDPVADYRAQILADDDDDDNFFQSTFQGTINQAFDQALLQSTLTP